MWNPHINADVYNVCSNQILLVQKCTQKFLILVFCVQSVLFPQKYVKNYVHTCKNYAGISA